MASSSWSGQSGDLQKNWIGHAHVRLGPLTYKGLGASRAPARRTRRVKIMNDHQSLITKSDRALTSNHSRAADRLLTANHSRAVDRLLTANHSRAVSRVVSPNHSRAVSWAAVR